MKFFKIILAFLAAESMLVFLITIVQENIFGGITYTDSPLFDIIFGGLGTFLSAFLAGAAAYLIVDRRHVIAHIILTLTILVESTWLIFFSGSKDPIWFDAMASSSLIVGVWLSVLLFNKDYSGYFVPYRKSFE